VKWNGKKYENIELNLTEPALVFKSQLYTLTGVEPERQKIMIKGGMLKDDTDLSKLSIPENHTFMMMGTAGELPKPPPQPIQFVEDMTQEQLAEVVRRFSSL
jgi:ubiquitin carboxyl-terminal hydrolase 14